MSKKSSPNSLSEVAKKLQMDYSLPDSPECTEMRTGIDKEEVLLNLHRLLSCLFPGNLGLPLKKTSAITFVEQQLKHLSVSLKEQIQSALEFTPTRILGSKKAIQERAEEVTGQLIKNLPSIRKTLLTDILAAYEGDPAATSPTEVLMAYPCIETIATHRVAHELYSQNIPILPRLMSEWAHSKTGIDIHPGAKIGPYFFIDHGTGVVIGETATIGPWVKIYQGVTLGALSFAKDNNGRLIKGVKRHPNIEEGVIIYAGSTVLGGETTIGHHSVIGGNCWITSSVPAHTLVTAEHSRKKIRQLKKRS